LTKEKDFLGGSDIHSDLPGIEHFLNLKDRESLHRGDQTGEEGRM